MSPLHFILNIVVSASEGEKDSWSVYYFDQFSSFLVFVALAAIAYYMLEKKYRDDKIILFPSLGDSFKTIIL